jgi:hypothetical protein
LIALIAIVILWLSAIGLALAFTLASVALFVRGAQRAFGVAPGTRAFGPPTTPRVAGPSLPLARPVLAGVTHPVPGWTVKMIEAHIRHCAPCRKAVAEYIAEQSPTPGAPVPALATILDSLEPETITRIVHLVEAEDAAATHKAQS